MPARRLRQPRQDQTQNFHSFAASFRWVRKACTFRVRCKSTWVTIRSADSHSGRGDSTDTPPYAIEREVEDIAALLDAAGGKASLYGHSSGAVLALEAALHLGASRVK